ncbi:MAG: hydrolase [Lachnospiraceae bacterium]
MKVFTREEAWGLLNEYTKSASLIKHALAVEATMRYFASLHGEDVDAWGVVGLIHDFDYEMFPEEHCTKATEILRARGVDEFYIHALNSHAYGMCTDVLPEHIMEKVIYTTDELTGLINALCLMRPSKSILDLEVKSVKKKFKDKAFAAGVDRNVIKKGCEMLGIELDEVIQQTIDGMKVEAVALGLKGNL